MPRAIAVPTRQSIWARQLQGQDATTIAEELQLSRRTVQHLLQRFREGPAVLFPAYQRGPRPAPPLLEAVLDYRRHHPAWGAGLIRVHLVRDWPGQVVPCPRTLQRWLLAAGLSPAPAGRKQPASRRRAEAPHEVLQVDAAEQLSLANQQQASWLRCVDECSGAFLQTRVFPPGAMERGTRGLGARATA